MPYNIICCDANYENEQAIGDYEGILEGFDYHTFLKGIKFKRKIPDSVRLYINKGDENLPRASLLGGPLSWLIFSQQLLNFTLQLIKKDVQVFDAPVYDPSNGSKINGYKIINPIRVIDCIDWDKTEEKRRKDGTILGIGKIYIKESKVGDHHLFMLKDCTHTFIVSDQLAKSIVRKGFKGISFIRCGVSK